MTFEISHPGPQHDDHCIVSIAGIVWRIRGISDGCLILEAPYGPILVLEVLPGRPEAYCAEALRWLKMNLWIVP